MTNRFDDAPGEPVGTPQARALVTRSSAFDRLSALAADLCGTSMAVVSVADAPTGRFLASFGVDALPPDCPDGYCGEDLAAGGILVIPDAHRDPRFAAHPWVTGPPGVRFYAAVPLVAPDGHVVGRFCVLDTEPRQLTERQQHHLRTLADEVMAQLALRRQAAELATEVASRRASEQALARGERLLHDVLASPDTAIYAMDLSGRFIMANGTTHRMTRQAPGAMVGRRYDEVLPAALAAAHQRVDDAVVGTGEAVVADELFPEPGGRIHIFRVSRFPLWDRDGVVYGVGINGIDVTEQRAAQAALRESEKRWHGLFVGSPVGIGVLDTDGVFRAVNPALCALFDRSEDDLLGRSPEEFAADVDPVAPEPLPVEEGQGPTDERQFVLPDGRTRWVWMTTGPTPGPAGQTWTLAHMQDVTERVATQQAVRDSEANLSAVAEVMQTLQSGGDARQTVVHAGRDLARASFACLLEPTDDGRALEVTSSTEATMLGVRLVLDGPSASVEAFRTGATVFVPDTSSGAYSSSELVRLAGEGTSFCAVPVRSGDRITAALAVGWSHRLDRMDDRRVQVISLLADQAGVALRQVALLGELEQLARTDALTGLPNRRSWDRTLDLLLQSRTAGGHPLSVALVDLDHFKAFNDTYGHAAGDDFLRQFAQHAGSVLRAADTVARWGGEEFAVALPDCRGAVAAEVLERIRLGVPAEQTCSIGYGTWDGSESAAALMERVDAALYAAKRAGRNRIQLAAPRPPIVPPPTVGPPR